MPELEQVRIVARSQISDLASEAETAPRRRTHLLLHSGPQDQVQRLMIVLQPGTYIRPHHHLEQWELVVLLQGRGDLLRFDGSGCLADRIELSTRAQVAQIPAGVWHGFVVREKDTAVLEIKPGPMNVWTGRRKKARPTQAGWSNGCQQQSWDPIGRACAVEPKLPWRARCPHYATPILRGSKYRLSLKRDSKPHPEEPAAASLPASRYQQL